VGTYFVVGVALLGDAVYNQGGTLDISIVGSLRDTLPRQDSAGTPSLFGFVLFFIFKALAPDTHTHTASQGCSL
jgi:hypothetical protein